jgi:hypothetical protein
LIAASSSSPWRNPIRRAARVTHARWPVVHDFESSSWREGFSLTEIRARFSDDVGSRIVGMTPMVQDGEHRRYREVLA